MSLRPKKHLGQNFLTSVPARNTLVASGELRKGENVLEIGPGKGMLTSGLLDTGAHVYAVEKDPDLVKYLQEHLKEAIAKKQLTLLEDDARNADTIIKYIKGDYTIVANIPYYITGALFKAYLSLPKKPKRMVVLIQKEVAERIVARDKKESILSLSIKAYGVPRIVKKVDKGSFYPTPKVDSAILCVDNVSGDAFANKKEEEVFFKVLHTGFAHKRKQLISNLREMENKETLTALFANLSLKETTRAEDLTLSDWLILAKKLSR